MWPGVTREAFATAMRDIADVTRQVLQGPTPAPTLTTGQATDARTLGIAAFVSGMGPLLGYWAERGVVRAASEADAVLRAHRAHAVRRHAMLADRLAEALAAMRSLDVAPTVLKGMHTAWQYLPDPGTRTIGDIDLLIRPSELARASEALRRTGLVEGRRTPRPFRSEWTPPGPQPIHSLELDHADNPWSVDLHIALERRYARGVSASFGPAAFGGPQPITINGHRAQGLAQPLLAAFLALHASYGLDSLQLARLVELTLVIRHDVLSRRLRWADLRALVTGTGTAGFVYPAFRLVEDLAPGTVSTPFLATVEAAASPRAQRVVRAILDGGWYRLTRRSLDDKLMWASGPRQVLFNLTELVWPSEGSPADVLRQHGRRLAALAGRWFRLHAGPSHGSRRSAASHPSKERHASDQTQ
jgi:hypothetical protein